MKRIIKMFTFISFFLFVILIIPACGRAGQETGPGEDYEDGPVLPVASPPLQVPVPGGLAPAPAPVDAPPRVAAPITTPAPPHVMFEHRPLRYIPLTDFAFSVAEAFDGGFARVHAMVHGERRFGIVNADGELIVPPVYADVGRFIDGVVWVRTPEGETRLLDYTGEAFFTFPPGLEAVNKSLRFASRSSFGVIARNSVVNHLWKASSTGGHIITRTLTDSGPLFGLMNTSGLEIIPPTFAWLGAFYDGRGIIQDAETRRWGMVDMEGTVVVEPAYSTIFALTNGLTTVEGWVLGTRLRGAIDGYGDLVIPKGFEIFMPFSDGLALVRRRNHSNIGFIDTLGEMVIPDVFMQARSFSEGLTAVGGVDDYYGFVWGFINSMGNGIVWPQFYDVRCFSDGMAAVAVRDEEGTVRWGFINTEGEVVIQPQFAWAGDFHEGLAVVNHGAVVYDPPGGSPFVDWDIDFSVDLLPIGGAFMLIDHWGRVVLDLSAYDAVRHVSEGILAVNQGRRISDGPGRRYFIDEGLWGYIRLLDI